MNKYKDFIEKNHKLILSVLGLIVFIPIFLGEEFYQNVICISAGIIVLISMICMILCLVISIHNCKRRKKINPKDRVKVKEYLSNKYFKQVRLVANEAWEIYKFLEYIEYDCDDFLMGRKRLSSNKDMVIIKDKDKELKNQIELLKLDYLKDETRVVIDVIFKYYDENGLYKK